MTTAVILAGGLGTRLRETVPDVPKPMAPIRGRPFLEHQMDYWRGEGVSRFVLSVGYKRELIMSHFGASYRGAPVVYAIEETPLGTGGGLLLAAAGITEPFVVLNGDTFVDARLTSLLAFHTARRADWTFTLFRAEESGRYMGMDVAADGRVTSLRSGTARPGRLANAGVYVVNPAILAPFRERGPVKLSLEDDILPSIAAAGGAIYGLLTEGRFIDIGVPQDYFRAADLLPADSNH